MTLDDIELYNAYWANEFDDEPVEQVQYRTVTGALINFERAKLAGQQMTITGCWITRETLLQLQEKRSQANNTSSIKLDDNREFNVIFDRSRSPSIESELIDGTKTNPGDSDLYEITLHLQIIQETTEQEEG